MVSRKGSFEKTGLVGKWHVVATLCLHMPVTLVHDLLPLWMQLPIWALIDQDSFSSVIHTDVAGQNTIPLMAMFNLWELGTTQKTLTVMADWQQRKLNYYFGHRVHWSSVFSFPRPCSFSPGKESVHKQPVSKGFGIFLQQLKWQVWPEVCGTLLKEKKKLGNRIQRPYSKVSGKSDLARC